jgi:hypothetical protein
MLQVIVTDERGRKLHVWKFRWLQKDTRMLATELDRCWEELTRLNRREFIEASERSEVLDAGFPPEEH